MCREDAVRGVLSGLYKCEMRTFADTSSVFGPHLYNILFIFFCLDCSLSSYDLVNLASQCTRDFVLTAFCGVEATIKEANFNFGLYLGFASQSSTCGSSAD